MSMKLDQPRRRTPALILAVGAAAAALILTVAIATGSSTSPKSEALNAADCLPAITLTDKNGHQVSLASLKGKPVLMDFIFTSCPGPCLLITNKVAGLARSLGPQVGSELTLVSITIDPEHDGLAQLRAFAKARGADQPGWLFLTGSSADIDRVLAVFGLHRTFAPDGSVDHIESIFLIGADGRKLAEYNGEQVTQQAMRKDLEKTLAAD